MFKSNNKFAVGDLVVPATHDDAVAMKYDLEGKPPVIARVDSEFINVRSKRTGYITGGWLHGSFKRADPVVGGYVRTLVTHNGIPEDSVLKVLDASGPVVVVERTDGRGWDGFCSRSAWCLPAFVVGAHEAPAKATGTSVTSLILDEAVTYGFSPEDAIDEGGSFIVVLVEGGRMCPSRHPVVHISRRLAEREAKRLAELHTGTFKVLKVVTEVSQPKPVKPPLTTKRVA